MLTCYTQEDLPDFCDGTDEYCYVEMSDHCSRLNAISDSCIDTYASYYSEESNSPRAREALSTDVDCGRAQDGAALANAAYYKKTVADYLPAGFSLVQTYAGVGASGGFAFLATTETAGGTACYVAYKGTSNYDDTMADMNSMYLEDCLVEEGVSLGQCGSGFLEQYQSIRDAGLVEDVRSMVEAGECPGGLHVVGHSLGGALSSLLTTTLWTLDPDIYTTTFMHQSTYGEPRAFDPATADAFEGQIDKIRWAVWGDPVTQVPYSYMGFKHFGSAKEIYYAYGRKGEIITFYDEDQDFSPYGFVSSNHSMDTSYIERLAKCTE